MKSIFLFTLLITCWIRNFVHSYNILMMHPFGTKSHKNVFDPIAEVLAQNGHKVTIMAPLKDTSVVKGVRNVHLKSSDVVLHSEKIHYFQEDFRDSFTEVLISLVIELCNVTLLEPEVQHIIKAGRGSKLYDVIVIDQSYNDYLLALGHFMGIPTVYLSTLFLFPSVAWSLNVPTPYSYVPLGYAIDPELNTFYQRASNVLMTFMITNMFHKTLFPKYEALIKEHIPDSPPLIKLEENVSLVLLNTNPAINLPRPTMPNVIEIGCVHCKSPKALPQELEEFMQQSGHDGVVYFSLGSYTKGNEMPEDVKVKIIEAFSKLPQKVLWKYDGHMAGLPKNIKLMKWAPQQDILGHSKVRLFISHGGWLSTQEAVFHGCPILGFPLIGDQLANIAHARKFGYAESIDWKTFTSKELLDLISTMIKVPRYKETAVFLSKRLQDQPQPPAVRGAYWIEYVIRHQGAPHLKSAAQHLNFFQYFLLDIVAVVAVVLIIVLGVVVYFLKMTIKKVCNLTHRQPKTAPKNKKYN